MRNTLLLYLRTFLIMAVTLYTSRIVLEALGEVDYGIYNVVAGVVVMIDFINAALYGATIRFMTYVMDTEDEACRIRVFSSIKFVHFVIGILTLVLGETLGLWFVMTQLTIPEGSMVATFWTYQCALLVLFISEINLPYSALTMAYERMSAFAYISILEVMLKLLIAFLIIYTPGDRLIVYSVLFLVVQLLIRFTYSCYCNKCFVESKVRMKYNKGDVRQIGQFASWSILGSIAGMGSVQGINVLLNIYFGPVINTARGIANQVHVACMKFCSNFQIAVKPQIIKSYAVKDLDRMHNLVLYSVKLCLYLSLIIVTPIFYFTEPILNIWLVGYPVETVAFVKIILIQELFYSISYPLVSAIEATGKIKRYKIIISVLIISTLPLSYFALKFGHVSATTVMLIYLAVSIITEIVRVCIVLPKIQMSIMSYVRRIVLYAIVPMAILSMGYLLLPDVSQIRFVQLSAYVVIVVIATMITLYVFGVNKSERILINRILKKFIRRKKH